MSKSLPDYDVLNKFSDLNSDDLEYEKVIHSIETTDVDYAVDVIFKHYRKYGFPHYTITEDEKHLHMKKLIIFSLMLLNIRILSTFSQLNRCFKHKNNEV